MDDLENTVPLSTFAKARQYRMQEIANRFARAQLRTHAGMYEAFVQQYPEFTNRKLYHEGLVSVLQLKGAYHVAQRYNPNPHAAYMTQLAQDAVNDFFKAIAENKFRQVAGIACDMQHSVEGEPFDPYRNMLMLALCRVRGPAIQMAKETDRIGYARRRPESEKHRAAAEERVLARDPRWKDLKREAEYRRAR